MKNACFDHWNSRKKNIQYALQGRTVLKIGPFYYAIRKKTKVNIILRLFAERNEMKNII